jgi:flagellin
MIGGVNTSTSRLASAYNIGSEQLNATLTKIATGKKFQNAAEDLLGYLKSSKLKVDISGYQQVKQDLTEVKAFTSAAVQAGSDMYEKLTEMKNLAAKYDVENTKAVKDQDKLDQLTADFDALKAEVQSIVDNTKVDGKSLTGTTEITSVALNPDGTDPLSIKFTADFTGISTLAITGGAAGVTTEMTEALTYLTESRTFDNIVDQQVKLADTIIASKQAVDQLVSGIDEAEEMSKAIDQQVRQQAAISMLAQANQSRQSVMQLYM